MQPSLVRAPRSIVQVNGVNMDGIVSWEVDSNGHYQSDTFRMQVAVSGLPENYGVSWWTAQDQLSVEISVGFPADPNHFAVADLQTLFYGRVDEIVWDLPRATFELTGRDLTGVLIDTKTSQKYVTQTASQVVATVAAAHGLATAITPTTTRVGRYYEIDHVRLQDERSEWDLLTWLAREEGFAVYFQGQTLRFEPAANAATAGYPVKWTPSVDGGPPSLDATDLKLTHSLSLAKDIRVVVTSWNMKTGKRVTATATAVAPRIRNRVIRNSGSSPTPTQVYARTIAGLDQAGAQKRANQLLAEISKHEVRLSIEGPADDVLNVNMAIQFSGTNTSFDQTFYPDSIVRTFDAQDGYRWSVEAKNHSVDSQVSV